MLYCCLCVVNCQKLLFLTSFFVLLLVFVLLVLCVTFFFSSRRRHTRCALVTGVQTCALPILGACGLRTHLWVGRRASDLLLAERRRSERACCMFPGRGRASMLGYTILESDRW